MLNQLIEYARNKKRLIRKRDKYNQILSAYYYNLSLEKKVEFLEKEIEFFKIPKEL